MKDVELISKDEIDAIKVRIEEIEQLLRGLGCAYEPNGIFESGIIVPSFKMEEPKWWGIAIAASIYILGSLFDFFFLKSFSGVILFFSLLGNISFFLWQIKIHSWKPKLNEYKNELNDLRNKLFGRYAGFKVDLSQIDEIFSKEIKKKLSSGNTKESDGVMVYLNAANLSVIDDISSYTDFLTERTAYYEVIYSPNEKKISCSLEVYCGDNRPDEIIGRFFKFETASYFIERVSKFPRCKKALSAVPDVSSSN